MRITDRTMIYLGNLWKVNFIDHFIQLEFRLTCFTTRIVVHSCINWVEDTIFIRWPYLEFTKNLVKQGRGFSYNFTT